MSPETVQLLSVVVVFLLVVAGVVLVYLLLKPRADPLIDRFFAAGGQARARGIRRMPTLSGARDATSSAAAEPAASLAEADDASGEADAPPPAAPPAATPHAPAAHEVGAATHEPVPDPALLRHHDAEWQAIRDRFDADPAAAVRDAHAFALRLTAALGRGTVPAPPAAMRVVHGGSARRQELDAAMREYARLVGPLLRGE